MLSPNLSVYQKFIHHRTYAREKGNRLEFYSETVDRYIDYLKSKFTHSKKIMDEIEMCREMFLMQNSMGSMRLFYSAGEAVEAENAMAFNCKYQHMDSVKSFADLLYSLLCTCGVGIGVSSEHVNKLPNLPTTLSFSTETIMVEDDRQGWASALHTFITGLYAGVSRKFNTEKVREYGAPLKTSGGFASGPEPLNELRDFIEKIFMIRVSDKVLKLKPIDVHDIGCKIADCAIQGGVRRAALISLFDEDDEEMLYSKTKENLLKNPHRYNANNTMIYKGNKNQLKKIFELIKINGEPGILFYYNMMKRMKRLGRVSENGFGANPCVTGDTLVLTREGYKPIAALVGNDTEVWNGFEWSKVNPFETGENDIYRIKFSNGMVVKCTPYHKWHTTSGIKEAKDLTTHDKLIKFDMPTIEFDKVFDMDYYSQGFYSADGTSESNHSYVYEPKYPCIPRLIGHVSDKTKYGRSTWHHGVMLPKNFVPTGHSIKSKLEWFAGVLDGDGNITRNPNSVSVHLTSCDYRFLMKTLLMLNEMGCQAKISNMLPKAFRSMPDGRGGSKEYMCAASYRLVINAMDVKHLLAIGLNCSRIDLKKEQMPNRNAARFVTPISITKTNKTETTYCLTEPKRNTFIANGVITGNCFEIIMLSNAFCNLVEAVLRAGGNLHDDMLKVRYATIMALMQATLTKYNFITPEAKKNQENDPIIGVSLTGLCDCERYYGEGFESRLDVLKQVVEKTVDEFWQDVGLKCRPKASTCVKPSGTVSQLVDCSSGIHPRHAKFYVRRILVEDSKKICGKLIKIGVPFTQMGNCKLFEFVFKAPETSLTIDECDIKRQLNYVAKVMKHWCDHNVSCTLYVRDNEWETLYTALENEDHEFIGLSFLPESIATDTSGFAYLPFEKITKEEYEIRSKTLLDVSWEELMTEDDDTAVVSREFACSGGSCSIS